MSETITEFEVPVSPELRTVVLATTTQRLLGERGFARLMKVAYPKDIEKMTVNEFLDSITDLRTLRNFIDEMKSANEQLIAKKIEVHHR